MKQPKPNSKALIPMILLQYFIENTPVLRPDYRSTDKRLPQYYGLVLNSDERYGDVCKQTLVSSTTHTANPHDITSLIDSKHTLSENECPFSGETFFIGWGASIVFVSQQKRGLRADGANRSDNTHCMKDTYSPTNNQGSDLSQSQPETNPDNQTKAKRGRPPKPDGEQRLYPVKAYFDHDSIMAIDELVARTGKSRSTIVYEIVLNGSIKEPLTTEQTGYIRKLAGMSNNLNQLAHEAHVDNNDELAKRNHDAADKIDALIDKLSDL